VLMSRLLLHCADLSNPLLPDFDVVSKWANMVCVEFSNQVCVWVGLVGGVRVWLWVDLAFAVLHTQRSVSLAGERGEAARVAVRSTHGQSEHTECGGEATGAALLLLLLARVAASFFTPRIPVCRSGSSATSSRRCGRPWWYSSLSRSTSFRRWREIGAGGRRSARLPSQRHVQHSRRQ
jgi:hypothetical protein